MKDTFTEGATLTRRIEVDTPRTIDFLGDALRVYSTPSMVNDLELTCRELLLSHADSGEDSVGARVEIDHLGATLLGMWVDIAVTVVEIELPRVTFEVSVHDALEQVGRARHVRFVIDKERQQARLEKKAAKVRAAE